MTENDLRDLPKARSGGDCHRCSGIVSRGTGYKVFVGKEGSKVMHVQCFIKFAFPKYVAAGIIKG